MKPDKSLSLLAILAVAGLSFACGEAAGDPPRDARGQTGQAGEMAPREDASSSTSEDSAAAPEQTTAPKQAPDREARPEPTRVVHTVPMGTPFAVRLNQTLSTETSRVGDPFAADLDGPIVDMAGTVLIPGDAVVRGRITGVNPSGRVGETAVIKLAFESVSFGAESYPLHATVIEANPERDNRTTTTEQAARVAAGAAAGAIMGQVLGKDTESTLIGAAVGAAAGTAIALGTSDVDAVLASGSRMVLRLNEPVRIERIVYR